MTLGKSRIRLKNLDAGFFILALASFLPQVIMPHLVRMHAVFQFVKLGEC
jgi:hypothetical protein